MNWSSDDIERALGFKAGVDFRASGISIDSRTIRSGEIFIALRGDNFDGRDYIGAAVEKGAVAIISDGGADGVCSITDGVLFFETSDSHASLQALARYARSRLSAKVIGITGSVGKTTTKEMLLVALSSFGECHGTTGNFNNHIGLPLVLVNCPESVDFLVLELGMNHAGEIAFLTEIAEPDLAIILNVTAAHMENFANLEEIACAKSEIFASSARQALYLGDAAISEILLQAAKDAEIADIRSFGVADSSNYRFLSCAGGMVSAKFRDNFVEYNIAMLGEHAAFNSLVALAAIDMVVDGLEDFSLLEDFAAPKGRGAISQISLGSGQGTGVATLIDESYNASPSSVSASLSLLKEVKAVHNNRRSVAILGDMLELGADEIFYHTGLAKDIETHGIDKLITVGGRMERLYNAVPEGRRLRSYKDCDELLLDIWNCIRAGDSILIKASHSIGLERLVFHLEKGKIDVV